MNMPMSASPSARRHDVPSPAAARIPALRRRTPGMRSPEARRDARGSQPRVPCRARRSSGGNPGRTSAPARRCPERATRRPARRPATSIRCAPSAAPPAATTAIAPARTTAARRVPPRRWRRPSARAPRPTTAMASVTRNTPPTGAYPASGLRPVSPAAPRSRARATGNPVNTTLRAHSASVQARGGRDRALPRSRRRPLRGQPSRSRRIEREERTEAARWPRAATGSGMPPNVLSAMKTHDAPVPKSPSPNAKPIAAAARADAASCQRTTSSDSVTIGSAATGRTARSRTR